MLDELLVPMIAVIKTFMRPWCCERLIASLRAHVGCKVIVVDDSEEPHDYDCDHYIRLPFDSGLSAGRNTGVMCASLMDDTVLLLDDDLELTADHGLEHAQQRLEDNDIVCGAFLEGRTIRHYEHRFDLTGDTLTLTPAEGRVDCGHNLMLCRSEVFARVLWDHRFKIEAEHLDFFLSCRKAGVRVYYEPRFMARHHAEEKPTGYGAYRFRKDGYRLLLQKWGLARINDTEDRVWQ